MFSRFFTGGREKEGSGRDGVGGIDKTPTHKTHLCSTVCSQAPTAQLMRWAQELHCHLCSPK